MNELLKNWLTSGDRRVLCLSLARESYFLLRAEKRPGFDYLYCQRRFSKEGLLRGDGFEYVGIYCVADGQVYDAAYALMHMEDADESLHTRSRTSLLDQLKRDVRTMVEQRVGNDRKNLTLDALVSPERIKSLENYRRHYMPDDAREKYLADGELEPSAFSCRYSPENWRDENLLDYIADPLSYAEAETERYWAEAQEEMLLQFLENDELAEGFQELIDHPENPVHIVRRIMAAMNASSAKTVNVTIRKPGEEFSFKTEASCLRRDCISTYNSWDIAAADRRVYEQRFGRHADYSPQEIVRITYGRTTLYES